MAILSITKQYSKAVFVDYTRTLTSVPSSYQPDVKSFAAGVLVVNGSPQPSGYYVETIDEAQQAGTITQEQHDEILNLNPDMSHRPVLTIVMETPEV